MPAHGAVTTVTMTRKPRAEIPRKLRFFAPDPWPSPHRSSQHRRQTKNRSTVHQYSPNAYAPRNSVWQRAQTRATRLHLSDSLNSFVWKSANADPVANLLISRGPWEG